MKLFFTHQKPSERTGALGAFYKLLGLIGPVTRASPIRRLIQTTASVLFGVLFFWVAWPYSDLFTADLFTRKEFLPIEVFLWLDPLLGISTAIAARAWNIALYGTLGILLVCLFFPRGFCGYLCPLGTSIDLFDWAVGRHIRWLKVKTPGHWIHIKYYLLVATIVSSAAGVLLTGYVAAIPVVTRGIYLTLGMLQLGLQKNWGMVPAFTSAAIVSIVLFALVFLLSLLGKRFWCRYVCPTGAVFSVFNAFRIGERKVEATCVQCGDCIDICPFDAIKADFTTRVADCTFCQSCGGACPSHSIKFTTRWNLTELKPEDEPPTHEIPTSRRAFVAAGAAGLATAIGMRWGLFDAFGVKKKLLRPPGSVPEDLFNDLCIRCGECFKVCPGPVLQPAGLEGGLDALWTPVAVPSHAGCHQECNFCTQVCPTQAIRPLELEEKKKFHMGLAIINTQTCLPHAGERDCQLCFDECVAAGYNAIEMREIKLPVPENMDTNEVSILDIEEMSKIQAPFILKDLCVGCGLCEYRCHARWVKQEPLLKESAVLTVAENETREEES